MPATLTTRRFTVDEYDRMIEAGILHSGERVELIEGEIVRMAAIGSRHAACVTRLNHIFARELGDRLGVRVQLPVRLSDASEPEPDIAIVRARPDFYADAHPRPDDAFLIVEVSETTVSFDMGGKSALYAAAGIAEYWVVDILADTIFVHRNPAGRSYLGVERHGRGQILRPLAFPDLQMAVDAVLP
ncbi:MAG: Uma2 family endonuclease [Gemmatimonadota bacterium]